MNESLLSLAQVLSLSPATVLSLEKLHLTRLSDLILHPPLRYEADNEVRELNEKLLGQQVLLQGVIIAQSRPRHQLLLRLQSSNGRMFFIRFIHTYPNQGAAYQPGRVIRTFGTLKKGYYGWEMVHPKISTHMDQAPSPYLTAIYPTTKNLKQATLHSIIQNALKQADLDDYLPDSFLKKHGFIDFKSAITTLHAPTEDLYAENLSKPPAALHRLQFDELLAQQLSMGILKRTRNKSKQTVLHCNDEMTQRFLALLSFQLTTAQRRVIAQIKADLQSPYPMHRLLQGDVGSGKTVVAALVALLIISAGYQVALLAPTELLAEQHFSQFQKWWQDLGLTAVLLTGSQNKKEKEASKESIKIGLAHLAIGTHALIQKDVRFSKLRLIIVDEQHRFGVSQRLALKEKAAQVDQLMMSATPIPRTLAMSYFADVDSSILDELPPGRIPVETLLIAQQRRHEVESFIAQKIHSGRQVYWVCPLIEESEALDVQAAIETHQQLQTRFPQFKVGLLHGRLKKIDKAEIMTEFANNNIQLLVATTVIEVGINVPNASTMVIEHPERMGLSQLHQLRGRVGRNANIKSECILLYQQPLNDKSKERLKVLYYSNDGFQIAEEDLKLRGPGEFLGAKQSGVPLLRFADLTKDADLIPLAKELAMYMLNQAPDMAEKHLKRWLPTHQSYLGV